MEEHAGAQGSDQSSASDDPQSSTDESHTPGQRSYEREYRESTSFARGLLYGSCLSLLLWLLLAGVIAGALALILPK